MASKSVSELFEDFSLRRAKKQHTNQIRCKNNNKLTQLDEKKRALLLVKFECAVNGTSTKEVDERIAQIEQVEQAVIKEEVSILPYACSKCRDKGVIHGHYCSCFLSEVYQELYHAVDIDKLDADFKAFDFAVFDDTALLTNGKTQRKNAEIIRGIGEKYINGFPNTPKLNMLLRGKAGLGKSFLLNCMATAAKRRGIDVCLIRAGELFRSFFKHRMGEEMDLSFLNECELLLIDDLGTEPITQNVSIEYFFGLIDTRIENKKHTVIATNVDDLQKRYDDRISSRLESKKDCVLLVFAGTDVRQ
ncbi:MAG: ATP-binding protein [Christensenellaceae bacterium]